MHRLFDQVEVSQQAHERSQNPARFRPVKGHDGLAELFGHRPPQNWQMEALDATALTFRLPTIHQLCNSVRAGKGLPRLHGSG